MREIGRGNDSIRESKGNANRKGVAGNCNGCSGGSWTLFESKRKEERANKMLNGGRQEGGAGGGRW